MNPFDNRLWNAQGDVPSLTRVWPADDKDAGLVFKKITNFVGAQIPHRGNFRDGIVSFNKSPGLKLGW
jgi:hypothetical protein